MKTGMISVTLCAFVCIGAVPSCATAREVEGREKGSVMNPVLCDMPAGQRDYLKRLRSKNGERVPYRFEDSVLGPEGRILDKFLLDTPEHFLRGGSFLDSLFGGSDRQLRIYMDMYHPGKRDMESIPGFELVKDPPERKPE